MVIFLTRKYPPSQGGMETFSYELDRAYAGTHALYHRGQKQRHVIWALPLLTYDAWRQRHRASVYHLGDGVLAIIAPLIRLFSQKPIVVTVHALEVLYPSRVLRLLLRRGFRAVTHFVAVSDFTKQQLMQEPWHVNEGMVTVIPHGAEHIRPLKSTFDQFATAKEMTKSALYASLIETLSSKGITEDQWNASTLLLSVGRLVPRKGVVWFLSNVLPHLVARSHRPLLYLIIGKGPELANIRAAIVQHELDAHVLVLGSVEQGVLELSYTASDVFVMPNVPIAGDAEGFGFVAIEAAAAGLPVISSDIEGIPSAIHNGDNGILLTPRDTDGYTAQLLEWIEHPEKRLAFGYEASQYTGTHYSWNDVATRYQSVFESLT